MTRDPLAPWDWRTKPEDFTTESDGAREKDAHDHGANARLDALRPLIDAAELALNAIAYWSSSDDRDRAGSYLAEAHDALRLILDPPTSKEPS